MKGDVMRVRRILREGPATSYEVAVAIGTSIHRASALLAHLRRHGMAVSSSARIKTGGRPAQLWSRAA